MFWFLYFIKDSPLHEYVYIAESAVEVSSAKAEAAEDGYRLSDEFTTDHDCGSWPTGRALEA